ncbi:MAG: hypothetical protein ACYCYE_07365 [Clostridia bacterium]
MKVMNIPSNILKPRMVIFEDVYNAAGAAILAKDTILDQLQIDKIHMNDIEKVRIKLTENDGLFAAKEEIRSVYNHENVPFSECITHVNYHCKMDEP